MSQEMYNLSCTKWASGSVRANEAEETLMMRSRFVFLLAFVVLLAVVSPALAGGKGSATALNCIVTDYSPGVASDKGGMYAHGANNGYVKCYLGVGGKDFDLVTYNSKRTLQFNFSPVDKPTVDLAGLPMSFPAEVDAYGINYWGRYLDMEYQLFFSTAQVQMDLQFHYGSPPQTYELSYSCLAVSRVGINDWIITSEPLTWIGNYVQDAVPCLIDPVHPGNEATLSLIRRKGPQTYGVVTMPIFIEFFKP